MFKNVALVFISVIFGMKTWTGRRLIDALCVLWRTKKQSTDRRWMEKAAREMDIELESDDDDGQSDDDEALNTANQQRLLSAQKHRLDTLLTQPIRQSHYCGKYPTQSSQPTQPFVLSEFLLLHSVTS